MDDAVTGPFDGSVAAFSYRRPNEADHARIVDVIDDWWDGRRLRQLLPRLWLQHFTSTSWLAETANGRLAGFLVGFVGQDDPATGYVHMVGTDPEFRRRGIGRQLYERFIEDMRSRSVQRVSAVTWPGNRLSLAFHARLGFRPYDGPGTTLIYGTPAYPDYDDAGEDRVLLIRDV